MRRIGFLLAVLALFFGLATVNARAQAACQAISFSVMGDFQDETNDAPVAPKVTNEFIQPLWFTSGNVVKAILLDEKGVYWTNWLGAVLERQVNLTNGQEGIYVTLGGKEEINVSKYFGDTYLENFTGEVTNMLGFATNNFTYSTDDSTNELESPLPPEYNGTEFVTATNHRSASGMHYLSLNTTNLKFNLVGASLWGIGDGAITTFAGTYQKTNHYSVPVQRENIYVVGAFSWNSTTNFYSPVTNVMKTFHSGPARGTIVIGAPTYRAFTPAP